MNNFIKPLFLFSVFCVFVSAVSGQTIEEARSAYSLGVTATNEEKYDDAIIRFNECLTICELLEKQDNKAATELKQNIQEIVPRLYLKMGSINYQNKQMDKALENTSKALETAVNYQDKETEKKAKELIPLIHYKIALTEFTNNNAAKALSECDDAIAADPNFTVVYYFKSVIMRKQDDAPGFLLAAKACIDACSRSNDTITKQKIIDLGINYLRSKGVQAKGELKYPEAVTYFNAALEMEPDDAITLYLLATIFLSQNNYPEAIKTAEKALSCEKGGDEAKAKVYMLIAEADAKNGDTGAACAAYKKAAVGPYYENANYQRVYVLKCE